MGRGLLESQTLLMTAPGTEAVLMPAVRAAAMDTAIVANGFSCREQIEQMSGRKTLHLAEVLASTLGPM